MKNSLAGPVVISLSAFRRSLPVLVSKHYLFIQRERIGRITLFLQGNGPKSRFYNHAIAANNIIKRYE